jgi:hypothetical protein
VRPREAEFFSPDYATARERFRAAASGADATLHSLPLSANGPAGEALTIDIAWRGSREPERVFLHICGLHGVEAYTGSAVQLALLETAPPLGGADAIVFVHVLNPYGMAWLRRTNEGNVDLNRNFLLNGESWSGAPALYRELDPLLNPRSPPSSDAFALRAAAAALRHGYRAVKDAIAEGQYEYPNGLFFGGASLQPGPALLIEWLRTHLRSAQYVFALDLHTGLGRSGTDTAIPETRVNVTPIAALETALERKLTDVSRPSVAYRVRGSMGAALPLVLAPVRMDCVLQEIGTYGPLTVLHALREENRWHFFGAGDIAHPAKQRLREALCPAAAEWRRRAVEHGIGLARAAARWTFEPRRASKSAMK